MRVGERDDQRTGRGVRRALVALALVLGLLPATGARATVADVEVSFGDLPPGKTLTVVFDTTVVAAPTGSSASNQGTLSGSNFTSVLTDDPDDPNSDADPTVTPLSFVDVAVTKTESADPVVAGSGPGNLTYTVTAKNVGTAMATGVEISEVLTLPAGVTIDSITPSGSTSFADPTWTVGSLAGGAMETLTVALTVGSSTTPGTDVISNTATLTAIDQADAVSGNDSATESTSVAAEADIEISKDDGVTAAVPGQDQVIYTIVVTNNGPSDDPSVSVDDTFPAGLTCGWTSVAAGGASGNSSTSGAALADTLSMPAGSSVVYTVTCDIDASATGALANSAGVTASVTDPFPANDDDSDSTLLTPEFDLQVTKLESVDPVFAGSGAGNLTYDITVFNAGPSDATGVTLSEVVTVPSGVTVDSVTPDTGSYAPPDAASGTWTVGTLPVGSSASLQVVLTVGGAASAGTDVISDTASLTGFTGTDTESSNDSATEATSIITNQPPTITSLSSASQSVQYSDAITDVVVTATDPDGDTLNISTAATLPMNLMLTPDGCTGGAPSTCTFTLSGQVLGLTGAGMFPIKFTVDDGMLDSNMEMHVLTVTEEDAAVAFDPGNPSEVLIPAANSPGGVSGPFSLSVDVTEADVPSGLAGMIGAAVVTAELNPGAIPGVCGLDGITPGAPDAGGPFDYDVATWTCNFDMVPVGDYSFDVTVNTFDFYEGMDSAAISIVDPCPIPHDGSDTDGDGIPDACDCPCANASDLFATTPGQCLDISFFGYTKYNVFPLFAFQVTTGFCNFQSTSPPTTIWAPVTPVQRQACRGLALSTATSQGTTCVVF